MFPLTFPLLPTLRSYEMHDHLQHKLVDPDRLVAIAEKSLNA